MPTPRNFLAKRRRLLQATGFSAVTALVAAAAFLYPGVKWAVKSGYAAPRFMRTAGQTAPRARRLAASR